MVRLSGLATSLLLEPGHGQLQVLGRRIEYRYVPPTSNRATTLVLLHEGLGCTALWKQFPLLLSEQTGLGVMVYSRLGYGGSDPVDLPRSIRYMHEEADVWLPALLNASGIGDHILLGHSDGASIATIYAGGLQNDLRINKLRGTILMAPHFFVEDISIESIRQAGVDYYTTALRERLRFYHGNNVDSAFLGWHDAWMQPAFRHWDICDSLQNLVCPLLVIQGEQDQYGSVAQLEAVGMHCMASHETALIEQCGHSPHIDQSAQTLDLIKEFLKKNYIA